MGIEKEIHQQKFRSARQKAMLNILFTNGWFTEKMKTILAPEDITPQQYNILRILRGSFPKPLSTLQIRERMLDRMSDTSRIVDRLVAKQLVKKVVCAKDRRLVDVTITERGQNLLKKLDTQVNNMDSILSNITEKEAETISNLLDKLRDGNQK
jgi:MarR family transcriptional regulator, 2-MHQ and catechol-resistance regulon repressor